MRHIFEGIISKQQMYEIFFDGSAVICSYLSIYIYIYIQITFQHVLGHLLRCNKNSLSLSLKTKLKDFLHLFPKPWGRFPCLLTFSNWVETTNRLGFGPMFLLMMLNPKPRGFMIQFGIVT